MYRILITLIITLSFSSAWSTSFTPVTIKNQVSESDGVVSGEVLFIESLVDDSGKIISKVSGAPVFASGEKVVLFIKI